MLPTYKSEACPSPSLPGYLRLILDLLLMIHSFIYSLLTYHSRFPSQAPYFYSRLHDVMYVIIHTRASVIPN